MQLIEGDRNFRQLSRNLINSTVAVQLTVSVLVMARQRGKSAISTTRSGSGYILAAISLLQVCLGCTVDYHLTPASTERGCVDVSGRVNISCISLGKLLTQDAPVNNSAGGRCLKRLFFSPGKYSLSESNLSVSYSIRMTNVNGSEEGMVVITCEGSSQDSGNRTRTGAEILFQTVEPSDANTPQGTAELEGITFQGCMHSLKFTYLESVKITSCTFRYEYEPLCFF